MVRAPSKEVISTIQRASTWWKCDLQVATPPYNFTMPAGYLADWNKESDRLRFATEYVDAICAQGIQVVAIANHNRADHWIDHMRVASSEGLTILPGIEITTATGQDGAHLIVFGDPECQAQDLDRLLYGPFGFGDDHPPFDSRGNPLASPKTVDQILDELSDSYIAIAPHALGDNGIASMTTARGSIRWKALHHPRLSAIEVGSPGEASDPGSWNNRFRRRELSDFPCLRWLPFIATSDSYSLEDVGTQFTWIRMSEPSIEGLRQAFLDRETRIIPSWDERSSLSQSPNHVQHAWIDRLKLSGLSTSVSDLELRFDPHLNVIIGGRGAGKSTIVNALLQLYGDTSQLPPEVHADTTKFAQAVFQNSVIEANHTLHKSNVRREVQWRASTGSLTRRDDNESSPTEFRATIISQKELYERAGSSSSSPHQASQGLLQLIDAWAGIESSDPHLIGSFGQQLEAACTEWANAIEARVDGESYTSEEQRNRIVGRISDLQAQLRAFDSPEATARRTRNEALDSEGKSYEKLVEEFKSVIEEVEWTSNEALNQRSDPPDLSSEAFANAREELLTVLDDFGHSMRSAVAVALKQIEDIDDAEQRTGWWQEIEASRVDAAAYIEELAAMGLDMDAYEQLATNLDEQKQLLIGLEERQSTLEGLREAERVARLEVDRIRAERRSKRSEIVDSVQSDNFLRFDVRRSAGWAAWADALRARMSLRADGFIADVPALAKWLWEGSVDGNDDRQSVWSDGLVSGDFAKLTELTKESSIRPALWVRLSQLERRIRIRIATMAPDDVVTMFFCRSGGDPQESESWQPVSSGSPGQRSAAMLSLVLAHGSDPLVLDQPEDDLDTEWVTELVVTELRRSRWNRQLIIVTHNANIPVNGDADRVTVLANTGSVLQIRTSDDGIREDGPVEIPIVREAVQEIMEGGVEAFVKRERRYNNELNIYRVARGLMEWRGT